MRKILGIAAASALALMANAASADEVTGQVSNIDLTRATFEVDGMIFTAADNNTVGAELSNLEEGDTVRVEFTPHAENTGTAPINAMILEKVE